MGNGELRPRDIAVKYRMVKDSIKQPKESIFGDSDSLFEVVIAYVKKLG
jgi:hypothetical protein